MIAKLYKFDFSPSCRAVMMACDIFQVPVDLVDVKMMQGENLEPEFLKKNPLHAVPVFEQGDFIIHDSHAILMYLADTYGKSDSWYPKETKQRALVNHKLFFVASTFFGTFKNAMVSLFMGAKEVSEFHKKEIINVYGFLEEFLNRTKFLAGDQITIADISAVPVMSSIVYLIRLDEQKYPKIHAWFSKLSGESYFLKWNVPGSAAYGQHIQSLMKQ